MSVWHPDAVTPLWLGVPEETVSPFQRRRGSTKAQALAHGKFFMRISEGFSWPGRNSKQTMPAATASWQ